MIDLDELERLANEVTRPIESSASNADVALRRTQTDAVLHLVPWSIQRIRTLEAAEAERDALRAEVDKLRLQMEFVHDEVQLAYAARDNAAADVVKLRAVVKAARMFVAWESHHPTQTSALSYELLGLCDAVHDLERAQLEAKP